MPLDSRKGTTMRTEISLLEIEPHATITPEIFWGQVTLEQMGLLPFIPLPQMGSFVYMGNLLSSSRD